MQSLITFGSNILPYSISAKASFKEQWVFEFNLQDPKKLIEFPKLSGRLDHLWQNTCFEAFVAIPSEASYWEFNFTTQNAWNVYKFENYRQPQPPQVSKDFNLSHFSFDGQNCKAIFGKNIKTVTNLEVSLNAVIKTIDGQLSFWALKHAQEKPDFHLRENFILINEAI